MKICPFEPPPCIIVPVYNAPRETEACLRAVIRETRPPYRILVLDDASTDSSVVPMLNTLAEEYPILELHQHKHNLGFAANVNYGMTLAKGDIVLLNSDTIVSRGWLDKLVACAYSRTDVATVVPVSNAAGAFSVPENNKINALPEGMSVNAVAEKVARVAAPFPVEAPTGNGFCLYIRRDALNRLGLFDAQAFPYVGEENDFGQRAIAAGLVNLVDSSTYIYHVRSASFGEDRAEKLAVARAEIDRRYPDYKRQVTAFLRFPELNTFRSRLRGILNSPPRLLTHDRPRILSVIHGGGGGMVYTNRDLMRVLLDSFDTYILMCDLDKWQLIRVDDNQIVVEWHFNASWRSTEAPDASRRMALRSIVEILKINLVHLRTLIGTGPEILTNLARMGVPVVFSFHDFATICPTIQLVDDKLQYCGGHCTQSEGDCRVSLRWFGDVRNLKHHGIYRWRERMAANLPLVDAFITTAESVKKLLIQHYPVLAHRRFTVIEHGRDRNDYRDVAVPPGTPLKVVIFGALGHSKGTHLLESIFKANAQSGGKVEFHVLGTKPKDFRVNFPSVIYHGSYEREELPNHLQLIAPTYAMVCSIWPETYCHTLTEAWMLGLPVLASDIGVLSERIGRHGGGRLIDPQRPEPWLDALIELQDPEAWHVLRDQIQAIRFPSTAEMAKKYKELYWKLLD